VEETAALVDRGLAAPLARLAAVGYAEALDLLGGRIEREQAIARVDLRTRQLAKRQRTWFRNQVEAVRIAVEDGEEAAALHVIERAFANRG
jgi:tRNA dimethylallyltransferase